MRPRSILIKHFPLIAFLILLSLPAIWRIVTPGYFPIHDDTQVARVFEMRQTLKKHGFPARWADNLGFGYGYPIFNFYNPLPYYFGAFFMFLGLNALLATKMMFVFPIILSAFSMYLLAKEALDRKGAFLAGLLYLYAPYHGVQIFVRGAVAEYWAYAILPLLFWAIWKKKIIPGALSLAALILSHNLTAFMAIPFILMSPIFFNKKIVSTSEPHSHETITHGRRPWEWRVYYRGSLLLDLISAFGLSAFFWVPALAQSKFTLVNRMVFQEFDSPALHVLQPYQLWSGPWGYGGSSPGIDDGLSLQLGKIHLLGSFSGILILLFVIARSRRHGNLDRHATSWLAMTGFGLLFSLFMLLPPSAPVWNSFRFLSYIQFPWRFLTFASLFSSLLSALAVSKILGVIPRSNRGIYTNNLYKFRISTTQGRDSGMTIVCLLFIVYSLKFFQPQFKYSTTAAELTARERLIWEVSARSYEYLPQNFIIPPNKEVAMRIDNPQNKSLINEFKQKTRPLQTVSNIISLFTLISLIGYYFYAQSRKNRRIVS